jgi:cell division protein ZipA
MSELRWILLIAGAVLLVGIYLWGRRSERRSATPEAGRAAMADALRGAMRRREASVAEDRAPTEPGTVAMPAGAGDHVAEDAAAQGRSKPASSRRRESIARREPTLGAGIDRDEAPARIPRVEDSAAAAPTPPRPQAEPQPEPEPESTRPAAAEQGAPQPSGAGRPRQKIVALRVTAPLPTRFSGVQLLEALEAEGMEFGRFDIFHKLDEQGRPLFSLANLLEPGTFDMATIREGAYPGIAVFAVVPGPLPAVQIFDGMLAAARSIAAQLGGSLQDERGAWLSAQRAAGLRDELAALERELADRPGH